MGKSKSSKLKKLEAAVKRVRQKVKHVVKKPSMPLSKKIHAAVKGAATTAAVKATPKKAVSAAAAESAAAWSDLIGTTHVKKHHKHKGYSFKKAKAHKTHHRGYSFKKAKTHHKHRGY